MSRNKRKELDTLFFKCQSSLKHNLNVKRMTRPFVTAPSKQDKEEQDSSPKIKKQVQPYYIDIFFVSQNLKIPLLKKAVIT